MSLRGIGNRRLPIVLAAGILTVDLLWRLIVGGTGSIAYGLVDVPAHLATALLALFAIVAVRGRRLPSSFVTAALLAAVVIDIDHAPGYLGSHLLNASLPRPVTHSLFSVAILAAVGWRLRGRPRLILFGAALGVAFHLVRDLVTGPGVPLVWPLSDGIARVPYVLYALAIAGLAFAATSAERLRSWRRRRSSGLDARRPLPQPGP
jgi:inner membrane protein